REGASMRSLKVRYGNEYKIEYEESYYAQRGPNAWAEDPDLQIIPCRFGHIYQHSSTHLGASTDARGKVAKQLVELVERINQRGTGKRHNRVADREGCRVLQDGD